MHTQWQDDPSHPGSKRGVGEQVREFGLTTEYRLQNHTYIDDSRALEFDKRLTQEGYETRREVTNTGFRKIVITGPAGGFELGIGFPSAEAYLSYQQQTLQRYQRDYPTLVDSAQRDIATTLAGKETSSVRLDIAGFRPGHAPSGQPLRSKDQLTGYLAQGKDLAEIVATVLTEQLGGGKQFNPLEMEWKPEKTVAPIWYERGGITDPEDLLNLSMTELNTSLVRVVQSLEMGGNSPDLIDESGAMDNEANQLLKTIEGYFDRKYPGIPLSLEDLTEKERALLALGLALKCAEHVLPLSNGRFFPNDTSTIGGITFRRFGESSRDRFEFYQQQDRKFGYNRNNAEAADFFLLHTANDDRPETLTVYERLQSENLDRARDWIRTHLEPEKAGNYDSKDIQKINSLLLQGLIPDRYLGIFRRTENAMIEGRIGMTQPRYIEDNLNLLLKDVAGYIRRIKAGGITERDAVIERLVESWACFDAIHPEEEGNGRTGTLLFGSWYRLLMGSQEQFVSGRKETLIMAGAISEALKGHSYSDFFYKSSPPRLEGDLNPMINYVKQHIVKGGDLSMP